MVDVNKKIHIGIIPDGNRRWCKENQHNINYLKEVWVNEIFFKELETIAEIFKNKKTDSRYRILCQIKEISLYVLSLDNIIKRGNNSVNIQVNYNILRKFYTEFKQNYDKLEKIMVMFKLNIIGEKEYLPHDIQQIVKYFETVVNSGDFIINIALAYSPKKDIEKLVMKEEKRMLNNQSNIDLLFRSGREKRISGFFPYHTFYSELYFSDKLWPDIRIADIIEALKKFNKTDRRFGK